MQDEIERARSIFANVDTHPPDLSTVDVAKAIEIGKRRRRFRRLRMGGVAAVSLSVVAAIAVPYALQADPGRGRQIFATNTAAPSPSASPTPAAKKGFQTRAFDRPAPGSFPASCQGSKLPVPGGGIKSHVSNIDPSGRYVTGRIYNDDSDPVLWSDGKATRVPMGGNDDILEAANTKGDAVGFSYPEAGPKAMAYIGGVLRLLKGENAQAGGINDRGTIVGNLGQNTRAGKPVIWPSADASPVELPLPSGSRSAMASDLDEDGTVVGHIGEAGNRTAHVWYPDGTVQPLPTPVFEGKPAVDFDARRIRNGWVTGYLILAQGRTAGVRWDLASGKAEVFDQLEGSFDVGPQGWLVGMDRDDDPVVTDGSRILKLPNVFAKAELAMNWAEAISDDGRTMTGHNDDKAHDGEQRGVLWKCR